MDRDRTLEEFRTRLKDAAAGIEAWRDGAEREYRFYDGHQWSDEDRRALEDLERAPIEWNHIAPLIDTLVGAESMGRMEAKFIPRTLGGDATVATDDDQGVADVVNDVVAYEREQCSAGDEENQAWKDALIQGLGCTNTRLDLDDDPDGIVTVERIDPFSVLPDPSAAPAGYRDSEFVIAFRDYSEEGLEERWPGSASRVNSLLLEAGDEFSRPPAPATESSDYRTHDARGWADLARRKRYRVYEYQFWRREPFYRWPDPEKNELVELSEAEYAKLAKNSKIALDSAIGDLQAAEAEANAALVPGAVSADLFDSQARVEAARAVAAKLTQVSERLLAAVKVQRRVYYRAFIAGGGYLDEPAKLPTGRFSYQFVTGKWDREKGRHYGLVRGMISPQEWSNKALSTTIDILQSSPKGGLVVEEDAIADAEKFAEDWARGDSIAFVRPGTIAQGKMQPKPVPPIIPQLDRLLQLSMTGVQQVSGVNPALRGMSGANTPGVTVAQYTRQGYAGLSQFFDSLRRYRREQSRLMLDFVRVMPDRTIARVTGSGLVRYIPFAKSRLADRYDLVVDEAPDSPNMRAEIVQKMQLILPTLEKIGAGAEALVELLENMGLPATLVEKLKQKLAAPPQLPGIAAPRPGMPGPRPVPGTVGGRMAGPPMPQGLQPGMMPQSMGPGGQP